MFSPIVTKFISYCLCLSSNIYSERKNFYEGCCAYSFLNESYFNVNKINNNTSESFWLANSEKMETDCNSNARNNNNKGEKISNSGEGLNIEEDGDSVDFAIDDGQKDMYVASNKSSGGGGAVDLRVVSLSAITIRKNTRTYGFMLSQKMPS